MSRALLKKIFTVLVYVFAAIGFGLVAGYIGVRLGLTNTSGIIDLQRESFLGTASSTPDAPNEPLGTLWSNTEEWGVLAAAVTNDQSAINKAAADSGVPARLIVANLMTEQLRLFFTEREFYKQFFFPLKILGSQTQFSWGVMGMKPDTAIAVENNLKNSASPYYIGEQYAHLLDFSATSTDSITQQRFNRMTDQHNHYWSYLYAGLYMKQVEAAWARAGFPIDTNVPVVSTLYNIGFSHSVPNATPQVGGAAVDILGTTYSFGGLAAEFYNSSQLLDLFPR
jgi:hypothetical protein